MREKEVTICGLGPVRSRFASAPDSIKRLFFDRATAPQVAALCKTLAQSRRVYRCVEEEELERVASTVHHGGVVAIIEPPPLLSVRSGDIVRWAQQRQPLLLLDRIGNPHNLGAIIRSAAFFGVSKIILPDHPQAALPADATWRVAEGGMDHVEIYLVPSLTRFISELKLHYDVAGTVPIGGEALLSTESNRPLAIVLGNEEQGLSREVKAACNRLWTFPGTGHVESLNVSADATLVVWELVRSHFAGSPATSPASTSRSHVAAQRGGQQRTTPPRERSFRRKNEAQREAPPGFTPRDPRKPKPHGKKRPKD